MKKKPVIGIIPLWDEEKESVWMVPGYLDGIRDAGGIPMILPLVPHMEDIGQLDSMVDGYLFTGGHDVDPHMYGKSRFQCVEPVVMREIFWKRKYMESQRQRTSRFWVSAVGFSS